MAGDIEMELMEVEVLVVILTATIPSPWPCHSLPARANNILQFFGKDNLGFRHQSSPTKMGFYSHHRPQNMVNGRKSSNIDKVVNILSYLN